MDSVSVRTVDSVDLNRGDKVNFDKDLAETETI